MYTLLFYECVCCSGKYLYIPLGSSESSLLSSPLLSNVGGPFCLQFAYHMQGGSLDVLIPHGEDIQSLWSANGDMGGKLYITCLTGGIYFVETVIISIRPLGYCPLGNFPCYLSGES